MANDNSVLYNTCGALWVVEGNGSLVLWEFSETEDFGSRGAPVFSRMSRWRILMIWKPHFPFRAMVTLLLLSVKEPGLMVNSLNKKKTKKKKIETP